MEDGPEDAQGSYERNGRTYTLEERDSEVWRVTDDTGRFIGEIAQTPPLADAPWPHYTAQCAGDDETVDPSGATDDWRAALDWLIDKG